MMRLLLTSLALLPFAAAAQPAPLRIALFASFPPMAYLVPETNKLAGIDVDLADYVGHKLGRPVVWQDVSYEQAIPALTTGRVDAIVQSSESVPYTMSLEPGAYVQIGQPLAALDIVIAFPKGADALRKQVAAALRDAVADGTYAAVLAKHGLTDNSAAPAILATASRP